jgi:hypothetical protein
MGKVQRLNLIKTFLKDMKTKINKESRDLLIALVIGDGTICNNNVLKLSHCIEQEDYLKWKIDLLNKHGLRNSGIKYYVSNRGFNVGKKVCYVQLNVIPFIKLLRKIMYKPVKSYHKIINRINDCGLAIWYMDDGHINHRKYTDGTHHGFYIRISTCLPKEQCEEIIETIYEKFNVKFYTFHEGRKEDSFSLCCGTQEGRKFLKIVSPFVNQIPSMSYKVLIKCDEEKRNSI